MMAFIGAFLFAMIFVFMKSSNQAKVFGAFGKAGDLIVAWAPFSFIIIIFLLVAPVASIMIMKLWPEIPEPEDPMARFKNADDVLVD